MAEKKTTRQRIKDYLVITFASAVYAVAVSLFLDPNSLAPGGVTGIAIILNRLTGLETGTWVLFINIPIIALGTWKLGWRFILSTGYCTLISSLFINLLSPFGAVTEDLLLAAVAGGCLMAVGLGLVFKSGADHRRNGYYCKAAAVQLSTVENRILVFCNRCSHCSGIRHCL